MTDLEARLRALASSRRMRGVADHPPPDVDPLLERARRRRRAKLLIAAGAALTMAVVLLSVGLFGRDNTRESRLVSTPDRAVANTTSTSTSTVAVSVIPAATPKASTMPPPPRSTTTTSAPPRRAAQIAQVAQVAQVAEAGLWLVALDGTGLHRVGNKTPSFYAWSPDGRYVAMSSLHGATPSGIDIVSSGDGSIVSTIPASDGVECLDWSSRGRLAWRYDDGSIHTADITASGTVDAAGARRFSITTEPGWSGNWDMNCRWSPDGSVLATAGGGRLFTFTADGARRTEFVELSGTELGGITWSPDGRVIAAVARVSGEPDHVVVIDGQNHAGGHHADFDALRAVFSNDPAVLYVRSRGELAKVWPRSGDATVEARIDDVAGLTPLPDWRWLHITKSAGGDVASELRFFPTHWVRGDSLLVTKPRGSACEGTYFGSVRVAPDGRSVAVQVLPWGGTAAMPACATRLPD